MTFQPTDAMPDGPSAITLEQVSKRFGTTAPYLWALRDVSCSIAAGEFVTIVGESGCGKTTLLRLIAGLEPPTHGRVLLASQEVHSPVPAIGFMFQRPVLLPWRTVLDNVLLPIELANQARRNARTRALELLAMLGLQTFAGHRPHHLSGGMQQRVALARTLLREPTVLLMDEPFGALDAITREQLNISLLNIWQRNKSTVVFITHDITEAVLLADRILLMSGPPGQIAQTFLVPWPRPRTLDMRFDAPFTALCRDIHQAMYNIRRAPMETCSYGD